MILLSELECCIFAFSILRPITFQDLHPFSEFFSFFCCSGKLPLHKGLLGLAAGLLLDVVDVDILIPVVPNNNILGWAVVTVNVLG